MKECLLCTKELKTGEHFTDLIFMNQQEEWICKECKEYFEQIGEIHCPRCFKDKEEKVCKDCEYWIQKGNMVEHEALYRYNAAMKDYFKRYKFEVFKILGCPIRKSLDQRSFAPPQSLSQLITSFIASESQGIRHAPFFTFLIHSLTLACQRDDIYFQLFTTKITVCLYNMS